MEKSGHNKIKNNSNSQEDSLSESLLQKKDKLFVEEE